MVEQVVALIVDESKWLTFSLGLALAAVLVTGPLLRRAGVPSRQPVLAAMSLFFGVTIGTMAFGHLLAVTTKLASGTLTGSLPKLYLIGVILAVPSWWLILHTPRALAPGDPHARATLGLNAWLVGSLLALGIHNLPLAVPGLLNLAYQRASGRMLGRAIVAAAVVVNAGLFVGSLVFLAGGQSFEEFRGLR